MPKQPNQPEFVEQIHRIISKNITATGKPYIDKEGRVRVSVVFGIGNADEDLMAFAKQLGLEEGPVIHVDNAEAQEKLDAEAKADK